MIVVLLAATMIAGMAIMPVSASAAGMVNRSAGLGDLFLLDNLFNTSSGFLTDNRTNLGDLFILNKLFPAQAASAQTQSLASNLKGNILLQVEANGEAWYVDPVSLERVFLGSPNNAFVVMSEYARGISNDDFDALSEDIPENLQGRFVIKTQDAGKMYYIEPDGNGAVYVGGPADAYNLIKAVGVGISDNDLATIPETA